MGEYFRALINNDEKGSEFLSKIREILRSGQLMDDHTVVDVLKNVVSDKKLKDGSKIGLILDGVPRTI
jgi:adenylate kinase family enzyme